MRAVLHGGPFDGCVATYDEPTYGISVRTSGERHAVYHKESDGRLVYGGIAEAEPVSHPPVSVSKEGTE